jgi:hypothetical protein
MGDGSSEPDPRCQSIRSGASVLGRRCSPSGGRPGWRRFVEHASGWTRSGRVLLRTRPVRSLAKPSWGRVKSPDPERSSEWARAGHSSIGREISEFARVRVVAADGRSSGGSAALRRYWLRPRPHSWKRGASAPSGSGLECGRFVVKPADQRGPHVGGNIDVPRSTQPLARCVSFRFQKRRVTAEGATGNDQPACRLDPRPEVGRARSSGKPGGSAEPVRGGLSCNVTW